MKRRIFSIILVIMLIMTNCPIVSYAEYSENEAASKIIIHYYSETENPCVYYWNSLPENKVTEYPGVAMTADSTSGDNWYSYTFDGCTRINMLFTNSDGSQVTGKELTRYVGEWWYKNEKWYNYNPDNGNPQQEKTDFREETVYSLIITRFYDGNSENNVHCWYDAQAGNGDSDPAWRGDFQGLVEKLDYIKALGFSAVMLTPVAQNASGYDYHGLHPINLKKIDSRYESDGFTYQDLIQACHEKGMKVMQEVSLSTGNFGESNLCPIFEVDENEDASDQKKRMVPKAGLLDAFNLNTAEAYWEQSEAIQYGQRLNMMKNVDDYSDNGNSTGTLPEDKDYDIGKLSASSLFNPLNRYHSGYFKNLNKDTWTSQFCQQEEDKVDLNTENPYVGQYLAESMKMYADMGVDAVSIVSADKVTRLSLEINIIKPLKEMLEEENLSMEIFGQIDTRDENVWYKDQPILSAPFYTWSEADDELSSKWRTDETAEAINNNINLAFDFIKKNNDVSSQPTSDNAFLNGITYHDVDYTKRFINVQDSPMMYHFEIAQNAFDIAKDGDKYYNDATWNMTMYQNYAYGLEGNRYNRGTAAVAENLSLMFTFRGIPTLLYGDEVEFQRGAVMDVGPNMRLSDTGRAYYGDYLEGDVDATDFSEYTAGGTVDNALKSTLAKHIQKLNAIRRAIPALQKGQYTTDSTYVDGTLAFIRRYTDATECIDSLALVTISNSATFKNIPNGTYIDAVTGDVQGVTNGTLSVSAPGKGNMRVYVCCEPGFTGIDGAIGDTNNIYLKSSITSSFSATAASAYTTETRALQSFGIEAYAVSNPDQLVVDSIDTDLASPQYKGTDIVITATGKTELNTEISYCFSVNGSVIQDFSTDNTCSWTADSVGTSTITVDVKDENGNTATKSIDYVIKDDSTVVRPVIKGVSPKSGAHICKDKITDITINAGGGNTGTNLLFYKYIIKAPDGNIVNTPYYLTNNTFSINPKDVGEYTVDVYVQSSDNTIDYRTVKYTSVEHTDKDLDGKCDACTLDFKTFEQLEKLITKVNQNLSDGKYANVQYTTASIDNLRKALVAANAITAQSLDTDIATAFDNLLAASTVDENGLIAADHNIVIAFADTGAVRGIAEGNGWYANGDTVTLKVTPSVGYTFSKWTTDTAGGTSVGTESTYTFTLAADSPSAYYAWLDEVKYTVTCGSTEGGTCSTDAADGKYVYGQTAKVTATAGADYEFVGWKDSYGTTVSTDAVYSFTVLGNTTLTPEFVKTKTEEGAEITYVTVSFYHQSGKLLDSRKVVTGEGTITTTVNAPTKVGFDFLGWSTKASGATVEDVVDFNTAIFSEDTSLYPVFAAQDITYTLTVDLQTEQKAPQSSVTVTAAPIEGKQFVGWKNADGNIVSYDSTYTFIITGDTTLTSYYEPISAVIEKTPTISMSAPVGSVKEEGISKKATMYFNYEIPENYTLTDIGVIYISGEVEELDINTTGAVIRSAKSTIENTSNAAKNQFYYSKTVLSGQAYTFVGYITYTDAAGRRITVYSNLRSTNYEGL